MARVTTKVVREDPERGMTIPEIRESHKKLRLELERLNTKPACIICGKTKAESNFYVSNDEKLFKSYSPVCKDCLDKIFYRTDDLGKKNRPTKESLIEGLRYLNRPFFNSLFEKSKAEADRNKEEDDPWGDFPAAYLKLLRNKTYNNKTFIDSDFIRASMVLAEELEEEDDESTLKIAAQNRDDVIRLLGYDPFIAEAEIDKPQLYAAMTGMLDSNPEQNEDMMTVQSIISIVRGFSHGSKIDDATALLTSDFAKIAENTTTIKNLQESKAKIMGNITKLAAENCLSLKNSKSLTKGENTWTGKIKKLKDINLRSAEVNRFDIETAAAMQQVAEISANAIYKSLKLGEDELSEMLAEAREARIKAENKTARYAEVSRILLRENLDLKKFIEDNKLGGKLEMEDAENLYSTHGLSLQEDDDRDE